MKKMNNAETEVCCWELIPFVELLADED